MKDSRNPEQEWTEQTLRSLEGSTRSVPSPWLYQQVRHRLEVRRLAEVPTRSWVLARVAFAAVLVAANLATYAHRNDFTTRVAAPAVEEYRYPTLAAGY